MFRQLGVLCLLYMFYKSMHLLHILHKDVHNWNIIMQNLHMFHLDMDSVGLEFLVRHIQYNHLVKIHKLHNCSHIFHTWHIRL